MERKLSGLVMIMMLLPVLSKVSYSQTPDVNKLLGSLPPGKSVTITYEVTLKNTTPDATTQVSNQASVSGSNFTAVLTNSVNTGLANPLPVEITSFLIRVDENDVELKWNTASEVNNFGFEIERKLVSADNSGTGWIKISFVKGSGNSNSPKSYSCTDMNLNTGKYLYRLKQVDTDGKFSYSEELKADIDYTPGEYALMQNYPNPFNPSTRISYTLVSDSRVKLSVYNIVGQQVGLLVDEIQKKGAYDTAWNAGDMTSGIYLYILESVSLDGKSTYKSVQKMMLLK